MATYGISGFASYITNLSTGDSTLNSITVQTATFDDLEGDTTFEVPDAVLNYSSSPSNDFLGTIVVNLDAGGTIELPVIRGLASYVNPDLIETLIVAPTAISPNDVSFPSNYDYTTLDTSSFPVCFAAGTLIATPSGERAVETLTIGDVISTADGGTTRVKWLGRQTVLTMFGPPERTRPVRVAAGALGDGLPRRDLTVTADHALLIDGILVNASALVGCNGIDRVPQPDLGARYTVYHIETAGHEIVLAEGTPAETLVDHQTRRAFDNYAEYEALYGEERREIPESELPRVLGPRQLPAALRARLAASKAA